MNGLKLSKILEQIAAGQLSLPQVLQYYLNRIEATRSLNAYIEVWGEEAISRAEMLQEKYERSPDAVGKLFGAVVSIKDVICYKDHLVTGGSKILEGFESLYSATAVERILEEDAIIIGRVNCDEFGMGSSNEHSFYGPVKNPLDINRVPGGSSGGSAAAVAADTCLFSLGSDTGGSVRQPAAFCGVIGFKPSYGRISRHGLLAYGSSFDQIGLIARHADDIAVGLSVISGPDEYDGTASNQELTDFHSYQTKTAYRIASFENIFEQGAVATPIKEAYLRQIAYFRNQGHIVDELPFDMLDFLVPTYYILTTAEASTNLSRYDGIRYGYRSKSAHKLEEVYAKSRTEGFGVEVKRRIMLGTFVLSAGYNDAYYKKAQKARRKITDAMLKLFAHYDFLMLPTSPVLPWKIGDKNVDPIQVYMSDVFTVPASLSGIPAIALPFTDSGAPASSGFQLMAAPFEEAALLGFTKNIKSTTT